MDWKKIPSLAALRAFEATARNLSYSKAARELNVTDAALRQHVRSLEDHFRLRLVERSGRGISITQDGSELALGLSNGFSTIGSTVARLGKSQQERPIRVALTPAFAENWLIPRLSEFWADYPDIEVDLAPSIKLADLRTGAHDLAVRYGSGDWPDCKMQLLASAEYTVVAAPRLELSAPVLEIRALKNAIWLFEAGRDEHRQWTLDHGLDFAARRNRFYPNNSMVLSAVRAGHGLSVQSRALVETDLAAGTLVSVFQEPNEKLGYYLVFDGHLSQKAKQFANWLLGLDGGRLSTGGRFLEKSI